MAAITGLWPIARIAESPNYKWWAYLALAIGLSLNVMDQSGVNIALPQIADYFEADIPTVQWLSLGYILTTSAMLMPAGRLSDMIGRKRMYLIGFSIFVLSAFAGATAQSWTVLLASKLVQGIGSAAIQANGMAMIAETFPSNERGKSLGLYMAVIGAGAITGPVAGGVLVSNFGWRSIFFAGIPVALTAIAAAAFILRGRSPEQSRRKEKWSFDWLGATFSSAALVSFLLAMTNAWKLGWTSPVILTGITLAVAMLAAFLWWETRTRDPMLDLSLFKSRVFSLAIGARFISFLGGSAVFFLMPFYLIQGLGHTAEHAALLMIPGSISMIVIGPLSGRLSDRVGTRWPAVFGMCISTSAMVLFSTLDADSSDYQVAIGMMLSGIGMASFSSPNSSAIIGSLPIEKYGIVSAFVNLARTSANMSGVALATTVVTFNMAASGFEPSLSTVEGAGNSGATAAFVEGMARAYTISAAAMVVALVMTIFRGEVQPVPELAGGNTTRQDPPSDESESDQ